MWVQRVTSFAEVLALRADWQALETACGVGVPFQTWEWTTSWWEHLHEDRAGVRDALWVCVARCASGEMVGIAPLMLTERPRFGPMRVRFLQFIGADPNITELRMMLCHPAFEAECFAAIQQHLAAHSEEWDWLVWEGLQSATPSVPGTSETLCFVQHKSAFVLPLAPTWHELNARFRRNIKESLRKCYNSLKRDGLVCRLETLEKPADIESALDDFFRLHNARSNIKGVLGHSDVFESPQARAFLIEVCWRLAKRCVTRVFRLWINDHLVSTRLGFEMTGTLYLYYSGWDPAYGQYSVMTTLVSEVLQYAIRRGLTTVNLSTGNDVSKTRWGPHEVRYMSGVQFPPRRSARAAHFMYGAAARLGTTRTARAVIPAFLVRRSKALVSSRPCDRDQQMLTPD